MAVTNSLAKSGGNTPFSVAIQSDAYQKLINSAIRDEKRKNRFITAVMAAVSANPSLQKCNAATVLSAALQGEALELSPSPAMGEYAIVPYGQGWNAQKGDYESYTAQFQIMTEGRVQLAMRTGLFAELDVMTIKEGEYKGRDKFTGKPSFQFIEDDAERDKKPTIGYYAYFKLLNGFFKSRYFSKETVIEHAKRYSKAFDYDLYLKVEKGEEIKDWKLKKKAETPWIATFDKMACNFALREVLKKAPKSIEMRIAEEESEKEVPQITELLTPPKPETQESIEDDFFGNTEELPEQTEETKPRRGRKPKVEAEAEEKSVDIPQINNVN